MMLVQAELVSHRRGRSTIKCKWKIRHGWLARWIWKMPKVEIIEVVYIGDCTVWRLLETYERVHSALEAKLSNVEAGLLAQVEAESNV